MTYNAGELDRIYSVLDQYCQTIAQIDGSLTQSDRAYIMDTERRGSETIIFGDNARHRHQFLHGLSHFMLALGTARQLSPKILEFGCGTGFSALAACSVWPGLAIRGLDIDKRATAIARMRNEQLGLDFAVVDEVPESGYGLTSVYALRESLRTAPSAFLDYAANADSVVVIDRNDDFVLAPSVFQNPQLNRAELTAALQQHGLVPRDYFGVGFPPRQLLKFLRPVDRHVPLPIAATHIGVFTR